MLSRAARGLWRAFAGALERVHLLLHRAQVALERGDRLAAGGFVRCPQQRRWVHRRDHAWRPGRVAQRLAALLGDLELVAEHRLGRRRAQGDDHVRANDFDLGLEPRFTCRDLPRARLGVNAPLAALFELEVFDGVGDVDFAAVDADFFQDLVEHRAAGADERLARAIFLIARLLADEHDARVGGTFAEDGLRGELVQVAALAALRRFAQGGKREFGREERFRGRVDG